MNKLAQSIIFFAIGFCWVAILWGVSGHASAEYPPDGQHWTYGHGADSCGEYIADSEENPNKNLYSSWALGAISYAGYAGEHMKFIDRYAADLYLKNYCNAHPLDNFNDAVYALIEELAESGVAQ